MKAPPLPKVSLPGRLGLALSSVLAIVAGFALASVLFVVLLVTGMALGGWLWWQYRRLVGRTATAPLIIEGEYAVVPEHPARAEDDPATAHRASAARALSGSHHARLSRYHCTTSASPDWNGTRGA